MILFITCSYSLIEILIKPRYKIRSCLFICMMIFYLGFITIILILFNLENCAVFSISIIMTIVIIFICYIICLKKMKETKIVHLILI